MKTIILDLNKQITDIEITEDSEVLGVWFGKGSDNCQQKFKITHTKPGLTSRITIKAVLEDTAVFNMQPLLEVKKGATATDSYLKIAVLLLSDQAKAVAVPGLEIHENEVKAGHGATIGRLDREQLLYLETRGLSEKEAGALLISAFTADIMSKIAINK